MAYRSSVATVSTNNSNSPHTVSSPTGYVAGDILVCIVSLDTVNAAINFPAGWTQLSSFIISNGDGQTVSFGYVVATGSDSFDFEETDGFGPFAVHSAVVIAAYSGRNTTTPNDVTPSANSPNSVSPPASPVSVVATGITTVTDGDDLVWMAAVDTTNTDGSFTAPSGMTLRIDASGSLAVPAGLADMTQSTHGATGNQTGTWTSVGESGNFAAFLLALAPAPSTAPVSIAWFRS